MNWFKHYVNASDDIRVFRLKDEMGYTGLGIYWTIMEMMARGGGCYARAGLMALKNRRTPRERIDRVLDGFGLFHTDADGRVTAVPPAADERPTSGITPPKAEQTKTSEQVGTKEDSLNSLAHAHVEEKREEKRREEENTLLNPPCEEVDDSVDKIQVDKLTVSCHPEQSEGSVNASNKDETSGCNQILHSVNSVQDDKAPANNCIPCNSVPSVSSVVCSSVIHELRTNRSWQEAVCMNSGYGVLLMRHFDRAVDIFLQHVKAGADEVELTDRRRAMNYFRNFTKLSHPAGRALKEELERMDSLPGPHPSLPQGEGVDSIAKHSTPLPWEGQGGGSGGSAGSASPFEDPPGPNGERSYHGGRPLPPDAPPRPSPHAEWDEAEEKWWEGYGRPSPEDVS